MDIYQTGEYRSKNLQWHAEDSPWKASEIAAIISANKLEFQSIAEVGCGAGQILEELKSRYFPKCSFSGYDVSQDAQSYWKNVDPEIKMFCTDFLLEDTRQDILLTIDVFEHVRDYMSFLESIRSRARYHIFHIPLELSAQAVLRDVPMRSRNAVGHLHYFSRTTALATLRDCGYRVLDSKFTKAALDRPSSRSAKLLNLLRGPLFPIAPEWTAKIFGGFSLLVLAESDMLSD